MRILRFALPAFSLLFVTNAHAWGNRGHHTICEAATRLVREPQLAEFLRGRGHIAGHVCNVPDIYWKSLDPALRTVGDPTHYFEVDGVGIAVKDVPADYAAFRLRAGAKMARDDFHRSTGSAWWRVEQFFRLAAAAGKRATIAAPKGPDATASEAYENAVFEMFTMMTLMGHYVGDMSMPYHNVTDYDGWKKGRGGIHAYYEDDTVDALDVGYVNDVFTRAQKLKSYKKPTDPKSNSVIERMRQLSLASLKDLPLVEAKDKVAEPSREIPGKDGARGERVPAVRPYPTRTVGAYKELILNENALSARLLADFWDDIYNAAGRPTLTPYGARRYPLTPEFVAPDYLGAP